MTSVTFVAEIREREGITPWAINVKELLEFIADVLTTFDDDNV